MNCPEFKFLKLLCAAPAVFLLITAYPVRAEPSETSGEHLWHEPGSHSDMAHSSKGSPLPLAGPGIQGIDPVAGHVVRVAYVVPTNRTPQPGALANLRNAMLQYQGWYRDQMERNGFGPKTFRLELEPDGQTPRIHVVKVKETDAYLRGDMWGRTINAASSAGVPVWASRQVWFLVSEAHIQNADGTITGGVALGASFGSGDDPGVAMIGGDALARFNPAFLTNDLPYNNQFLFEIGQYALKQDVSFPWFEGSTFSSISSSILGAGIHEISHGFGLPHDFRNDQNFKGNLMANGLRGIRGALYPERYPSDYTRAAYGSALSLNVSRYFNPGATYTENTKPMVIISTTGTNTPVNGLLQISFSAYDASGLSAALLQFNGDAVEEMPLSGTSVSKTFATAYYTPGQTNQFTVSVWDTQGNKHWVETFIVPRTGFNRAPRPFVTLSTATALVGQSIVLDASGSTDPDGSLGSVQVEWDLDGDGTFDTTPTTNKKRTTSFDTPGDRMIRCRLTDISGAQAVSAPVALRVLPPAITIALIDSTAWVTWSTNAAGFVLRSTTSINAPNWQTVERQPVLVNGQHTVSFTNAAGSQYFRLEK
jgi:hypothetical protein